MEWHRYRFRSVWRVAAAPGVVRAVLERAEEYPEWWPQVRGVDADAGRESGTVRFRSVLPYDLVVTVRADRGDPAAGELGIRMDGDLEGWARWTLTADGAGGTRVVFEQDVVVRKPLMRRLALPGRPFFRLNHALMMRAGERGLRSALAARG